MKDVILALLGFSSGVTVAAGTFAFIAAIGIVPRMAQRTHTSQWIRFYDDIIVLGGLFGTTTMYLKYNLPIGAFLSALWGLAVGIFVGVLAMALAEVLNVMPILMRRGRLRKGIPFLVLAFALGKTAGTLVYFFMPGFYE